MRIKEQETRLTLQEHDVDDDDDFLYDFCPIYFVILTRGERDIIKKYVYCLPSRSVLTHI